MQLGQSRGSKRQTKRGVGHDSYPGLFFGKLSPERDSLLARKEHRQPGGPSERNVARSFLSAMLLCVNTGELRSSWHISSLSAFAQILSSLQRYVVSIPVNFARSSHTEECEAAYLQTVATPRDRLCRAKLRSTWACIR